MKIRPAQAILNEIRQGAALEELSQHLHDATAAVSAHNKPATVTLTITISPFKGSSAAKLVQTALVVLGEVTSKLPKADPEATVFFESTEGNLVRTQERQSELGLSVASINKETGEINERAS